MEKLGGAEEKKGEGCSYKGCKGKHSLFFQVLAENADQGAEYYVAKGSKEEKIAYNVI